MLSLLFSLILWGSPPAVEDDICYYEISVLNMSEYVCGEHNVCYFCDELS